MLKTKPSKASLKSRGLQTNIRAKPMTDHGQYSLYSTDSEDNVLVVSKGLDKCAKLLTNILEINNEKAMKLPQSVDNKKQKIGLRQTRKQVVSSCLTKNVGNRIKATKTKKKASDIPTTILLNAEKSGREKNSCERVVASTPVLQVTDVDPASNRQRELQAKASVLQHQINELQEQYNKLHTITHDSPSNVNEKEKFIVELPTELPTNAEKPFEETGHNETKTEINREGKQNRKVTIAPEACYMDDAKDTSMTRAKEPEQTLERVSVKYLSPHRNADHSKIVEYLIRELRSVLGTTDVEVERLLMEIENETRLLSYPIKQLQSSENLEHEIEIALQPLRSENSDLRRKLRISNQRSRELETRKTEQERPSLSREKERDSVIQDLHMKLLEEKEKNSKERHEKENTEKMIRQQIEDKKRLEIALSDKDNVIDKFHKELLEEKEKTNTVTNQLKIQMESTSVTLRARDKEIALLQLALKQRDTEIERLTELTRGLQLSLAKLLTNMQRLQPDDVISDVSSVNTLFDSCAPRALEVRDLSLEKSVEKGLLYKVQGKLQHQNREYIRNNHVNDGCDVDINEHIGSEHEHEGVSVSVSCCEVESTFKQDLADLDNAIARLQTNLRRKR